MSSQTLLARALKVFLPNRDVDAMASTLAESGIAPRDTKYRQRV